MKRIDLTNKVYERLKVIGVDEEKSRPGCIFWTCVCECSGKKVSVSTNNLRRGNTRLCGCLSRETTKLNRTTHGMTNSSEYRIWNSMWSRCYNEKDQAYSRYGAHGIVMSDEWKDSFEAFYRDMGPRLSKYHSIDRKRNNEGYNKDNCRWATWEEQNNNRRNNVFYKFNNVWKTLPNWCRELNLDYNYVRRRINKGLGLEEIIKGIR